jgi:hypothetical protein
MRFTWEGGTVEGAWHRPAATPSAALVLAHGAGKDMDDPLLVGVAEGLCDRGVAVVRFNFPYREAGRRAPGPQRISEDCYREVAEAVAAEVQPLYLGGKSYGGRMASHIVADGHPAAGLVFLGYPLHAPGRFDKLRDEHLGRIGVPMLFCQGTKDTFARPDLLEATLERLPGAELVAIEAGDHSFKVRGRAPAEVTAELVEAVARFVGAGRP